MKVTVAEAAQLVNRSLTTFKKAIAAGEIPVHSKPGPLPTYVVELDDVIACFRERRRRYLERPHIAGPGRGIHRKVKPE